MSNIKVLGERVVVEIISQNEAEQQRLEESAKRAGISVPPSKDDPSKATAAPVLGRVYALGSGIEDGDGIKVGDLVAYREKAPHGFKFDNKKLLALHLDQIDAVLESE